MYRGVEMFQAALVTLPSCHIVPSIVPLPGAHQLPQQPQLAGGFNQLLFVHAQMDIDGWSKIEKLIFLANQPHICLWVYDEPICLLLVQFLRHFLFVYSLRREKKPAVCCLKASTRQDFGTREGLWPSFQHGLGKCAGDVDRSPSWWQEKGQASEQGHRLTQGIARYQDRGETMGFNTMPLVSPCFHMFPLNPKKQWTALSCWTTKWICALVFTCIHH